MAAVTALRILIPPLRHHFDPPRDRHPHCQHHLDAVRLRTRSAPQALHCQFPAHPPRYQCLQFE
jgi:hypothetical protein